jgi:hypothetical protein
MRKLYWLLLFVFGVALQGFSQTFFVSQPGGGNWNVGTTWDQTGCASGCVAGVDYPGPNDIAVILVNPGSAVSLLRTGSPVYEVKDLYIVYNVVGSLRATGISGTPVILINGQMSGVLDDLSDYAVPTVNVFQASMSNVIVRFTGSNLDDPTSGSVLGSWGFNTPIVRAEYNPGTGNELRIESHGITNSATMQSGTTRLISGNEIRSSGGSSSIVINTGATFSTEGNITGNGTPTTLFPTITVNGTLTTGTNSYVNGNTFTVGSVGVVNVGFSNVTNQTESWWYQSTRPTTLNINSASNVTFNAPATQRVYTTTYGNLNLSGTGAKSFVGDETMTIKGQFNIASSAVTVSSTKSITFEAGIYNDGSFTSSQPVFFQGAAVEQKIEGSASFILNSGLTVNKSAGVLLLDKNISVGGGLTISAGTFDLGDKTLTLTSGNISKSGGTLTADVGPTGGSIVINGTTSVSGASPITFNNLTVALGGVLTAHGTSMSITGDFVNNGTFNRNSGTIVFSGAAQTIGGSAVTRVNNVTIQAGSDLTNENSNTLRLDGILSVQGSGTFDADGAAANRSFIVSSSTLAAGGKIAALPSPATSLTGNIRVERFMDGPDSWRYIASPVVGANLSMWRDDFPVTGSFSDASPNGVDGVVSSTAASIFRYRSSNASATAAYVAITGATTSAVSLTNGLGYSAYTYLPGNFTITVTGTHRNVASFSQSGLASGFHLLGNPYPCPIDYDLLTKSAVSSTVYLRTANNEFTTWNGTAIAGAGNPPFAGWAGEIATGQAFWVEATSGAGSVTFAETAKITTQNQYVREEAPADFMRISLRQTTQRDDAIIMFREDATNDFDLQYEGTKNKNGNVSGGIYSHINLGVLNDTGDRTLTYNALPYVGYSEIKSVYLSVEDVKQGIASSLMFSELDRFSLGYSIVLNDLFLNKTAVITEGYSYNFQVTEDPLSYGGNRFRIDFVNLVTSVNEESNGGFKVFPNPAETIVRVQIPAHFVGKVKHIGLYDIQGVAVQTLEGNKINVIENEVKIDVSGMNAGMYVMRVQTTSGSYNVRLIKK